MALVSALTDNLDNRNGKSPDDSDVGILNLADPSLMKVVKREGNIVPYDKGKIHRAVGLCFTSVMDGLKETYQDGDLAQLTQIVTDQVDTILRLKSKQLSADGYPA